jgi:endonuclease-3
VSTYAETVYRALIACYGEPIFVPGEDPVDMLVGTILSANTNDSNSGRAFDQLKAFSDGDWERVRTAPLELIKDLIRPAGMYNQKAPYVVATLERIQSDFGAYRLDSLASAPLDEAMAWLMSLPGVGHKTASIVMLFCFNRAAFPVDTHVQRISQRLGVASGKASAAEIKRVWESLIAPECFYALHLNFIRLGREICRAQRPLCELCPVQAQCAYASGAMASGEAKKPPVV